MDGGYFVDDEVSRQRSYPGWPTSLASMMR